MHDDNQLFNLATKDVLSLEMSFDTLGYELTMKKPQPDDVLQKWFLDNEGSLRPDAHPDLFVRFGESIETGKEGGAAKDGCGRKSVARVSSSRGELGIEKDGLFDLVVLKREKEVETY